MVDPGLQSYPGLNWMSEHGQQFNSYHHNGYNYGYNNYYGYPGGSSGEHYYHHHHHHVGNNYANGQNGYPGRSGADYGEELELSKLKNLYKFVKQESRNFMKVFKIVKSIAHFVKIGVNFTHVNLK